MVCAKENEYNYDVALRKESVDRNVRERADRPRRPVALRKESVDRNNSPGGDAYAGVASLSARRAWIEIGKDCNIF